jgi:pSer/pThr/pTyr-binding forkhead associated (FHA) protein
MFALEIGFKGDSLVSETIFIRRPTALISARDTAHVVIDDMSSLGYGILITRDVGRRFRLSPLADSAGVYTPQFLDGLYEGEAVVDLGPLVLRLTALDNDLLLKDAEAPDRAGIRVLRQACAGNGPRFPAVLLVSNPPATISFVPEQPLMVGRSRQCTLRVDTPSISSRHARIGFESGQFWVEDLGSTNGTFVNHQQISGRVNVAPGIPISLGRDVTLVGILSAEEATGAMQTPELRDAKPVFHEKKYPLLISLSEAARPAQLVMSPGTALVLGRDPSSDMWLGVPHVSRRHCSVEMTVSGVVRVTDASTNGTSYDGGILQKDQSTESSDTPLCLDFGGGVTVGICFSEDDEVRFVAAGGAPNSFINESRGSDLGADSGASRQGKRRKARTTFLRTPEELRRAASDVSGEGRIRRLFTRLSLKGQLALLGVIGGVVVLTSLIVGSLVSGLK